MRSLLVLIGLGTGMVRTLLREYGFRLDRTEVGLRRRRGLLTLTDVTLPARGPRRRSSAPGRCAIAFGWRDLKLQSLASDEGGKGDHVVAPLADDEEIGTILAALGWRPLPESIGWQRVSSRLCLDLRARPCRRLLLLAAVWRSLPAADSALASLAIAGAAAASAGSAGGARATRSTATGCWSAPAGGGGGP